MTLTYDLSWSFRSPYFYRRRVEAQIRCESECPAKSIRSLRMDGFVRNVDPLWWSNPRRDVARIAEMLGMPCISPKLIRS